MSAFLPQVDPAAFNRRATLQGLQLAYQYNYTHVSPLAMIERMPIRDEFSLGWLIHMSTHVLTALANRAELNSEFSLRDHHEAKQSHLHQLLIRGENAVIDLRRNVCDTLKLEGRIGAEPARPQSLEDFASIFRTIGLPPVAKDYRDDRSFAWMRLAGPNPIVLRRMQGRDERLPLTDEHLRLVTPCDSLDAAFAEGRMFLADYSALEGAECGTYPNGQKYIYAPLAVFVAERESGELRPVAIQCKQTPGTSNPVFTPDDDYGWLIAKTIVEVADGNLHEPFAHLGRTHLFMEPFVISSFRQLAPSHPLSLLLQPHFQGTLAINEAAWKHLISTKGAVDKLLGCTIDCSRALTVRGVQSAEVANLLLPMTFAERGVDDADVISDYPYRDDALLYWNAIREWVTAYLALYYRTDADVVDDVELQAWGRELAASDGGRIRGLPNGGAFHAITELVDVVTLVIYTCSAQHAAVNFPQYDLMSYVPNMPLAAYQPAPTSKSGATEADYLAMLPPLDMAELQGELGYLLGSMHYTELGQYGAEHFKDVRVSEPLRAFQTRLAEIGGRIQERNTGRRRPYKTLDPVGVPQSINV